MIDYSNYNLSEMQAILTVLDDLTDEMSVVEGYEQDFAIALSEFMRASNRVNILVRQQARDHAAEAEQADPPAEPDMFGWVGDALDDLCAAGEVLGSDEWIDVKTRLPEERCAVLGYCRKSMCVYTVYRQGEHWMHYSEHTAPVFYPVTHWMPLPESPRRSSND